MTDALIVLTTVPSPEVGERLARALVDAKVAACVNILPPMISIYRWKGAVQQDTECQLLIKTTRARLAAARAVLREHHPYELPEFLTLAVGAGDPDYLAWVEAETRDTAQ